MPADRVNMCRAWSADFAVGWGRDCGWLLDGRTLPPIEESPPARMTYAAGWYATRAVSRRAAELAAGVQVMAIAAGQPAHPGSGRLTLIIYQRTIDVGTDTPGRGRYAEPARQLDRLR
jgi:hypothetical protein